MGDNDSSVDEHDVCWEEIYKIVRQVVASQNFVHDREDMEGYIIEHFLKLLRRDNPYIVENPATVHFIANRAVVDYFRATLGKNGQRKNLVSSYSFEAVMDARETVEDSPIFKDIEAQLKDEHSQNEPIELLTENVLFTKFLNIFTLEEIILIESLIEGYSYREIAEECDCSLPTIVKRVQKIRGRLRGFSELRPYMEALDT